MGEAIRLAPRHRQRFLRGEVRELTLVAVSVLVSIGVGLVKPGFLSGENLQFILLNSVVLGLLSIGQTFVLMTKGIDLSVSAVMGLSAVIFGLASTGNHLSLAVSVVSSVLLGLALGSFNGLLVAVLDIPPIIVTLGTFSIYGGFNFMYSNGVQVNSVSESFNAFGNGFLAPWLPLPIPVLILGLILLACSFMKNHLRFGRAVLAVGNNKTAAYHAGINIRATLIGVYALSGALAAFGGLVFVAFTGSATATTGTAAHYELQSIAIALIGGTPLTGGRGNLVGAVVGSIFLSTVITALVFLHVPAIWYAAGEGLMIVLAVTFGGGEKGP